MSTGRRRAIYVEGLTHAGMPIPNACRVDNIVMSGGIGGENPSTGELPESIEAQAEQMFANFRAVLAAAGAGPEDVVKVTCFVGDRRYRVAINPHWVAMFPDAASRPARHTLPAVMDGGRMIQCDFMAVVRD